MCYFDVARTILYVASRCFIFVGISGIILCITCMSFFNSSVIMSHNTLLDPHNYLLDVSRIVSSTEVNNVFGLLQPIARSSNVFWISTGRAEKVRNISAKSTYNVGQQTLIWR
ncbi:hypothetical protein QYE76_030468 [Lolium multiflorum]|uniref:Uncharacterized protein n=1 Tax=Lolium multiflorum TaxID=4521 RepID=A0AAD8VHL1_LOLMU|nr:hypothetical protein QYE76_030457 [Lolium multiflorum]KAK1606795.1 hypothetical protein QYE76_030468 [Lolium multiflorum]